MQNNDSITDQSDLQIEIVAKTGLLWVLRYDVLFWGKAFNILQTYVLQNSFSLYRNEATSSNHIIIKIYSRLSVENDEKAYIVV